MEKSEVTVFDFCRHLDEVRDGAVNCNRFGLVSSCAPCSICPKCGGRMQLGDRYCSNLSLLRTDVLGQVASCILCSFRKNPGEEAEARIIEPKHQPKENEVMAKPVRICADCGESKPINGRGLCGTCYHKHKRHGTLETFIPGQAGKPIKETTSTVKEKTPVEKIITGMAESLQIGQELHSCSAISLPLRDDERDKKIISWLEQQAYANRRELGSEILSILEQAMAGAKGG